MTSVSIAFALIALGAPLGIYGAVLFFVWSRRHPHAGYERHSYAWPRPEPVAEDQPPARFYGFVAVAAILLAVGSLLLVLG